MKDNGKAAIVVPTGFLTAKSKIEYAIRQRMVIPYSKDMYAVMYMAVLNQVSSLKKERMALL